MRIFLDFPPREGVIVALPVDVFGQPDGVVRFCAVVPWDQRLPQGLHCLFHGQPSLRRQHKRPFWRMFVAIVFWLVHVVR